MLREIAALKRRVPKATADAYAESLRATVAADDSAVETARVRVRETAAVGGQAGLCGKGWWGFVPRQADMEATFAGTIDGLRRLKRDMPDCGSKWRGHGLPASMRCYAEVMG